MFPRLKVRNIHFALAITLALTFLSQQLEADFIPPYDVPQGFLRPFTLANGSVTPFGSWTLQTSGTPSVYAISLVQADPSQVYIQTGIAALHGIYSLDLQLAHTILGTGVLSFDYSLSLVQTIAPTAPWNFGGYLLDGVLTQLPAGTGSVSLPVRAGDVFAFEAYGFGNCFACGPGGTILAGGTTLTITHFNAPAPVPEPATTTLLICGAGLALARVRPRARLRAREVVDLAIDQPKTS